MSTIKSSAEHLTLNADGANNDVIIQSNGSTKVTVDGATGNVGVGTSSPNNPVHINGGAADTALQITNNATGTAATDGFSITVENPTASVAIRNREATDMKFLTSNTERMRILAAGGLTFNGDTAAANALDDYEEGTWTPTWSGATASAATYTKIGRMVYASGQFSGTGSGTSGDCGGLPYASAIDGSDGGGSGYHGQDAVTWSVLKINSTGFRFYTGSSQKQISDSNPVRFFLTYHV